MDKQQELGNNKPKRTSLLILLIAALLSLSLITLAFISSNMVMFWIGTLTLGIAFLFWGIGRFLGSEGHHSELPAQSQQLKKTTGGASLVVGFAIVALSVWSLFSSANGRTALQTDKLVLSDNQISGSEIDLSGVQNGGNNSQEIDDAGVQAPFPDLELALPANSNEPPKLIIPELGIEQTVVTIPINDGVWDLEGLDMNIGWLPTTGNQPKGQWAMALAAHVTLTSTQNGPFYKLSELTPGSEIIYRWNGTDYIYTLGTTEIVPPDNVEKLYVQDGKTLILVTCTNWDHNAQTYAERVLVFATLQKEQPSPTSPISSQ
ncbi:MAG TPA: class F sortase [Anaerolineales bacterium]|nr:class F sortase [Anaerolineales bacterium]